MWKPSAAVTLFTNVPQMLCHGWRVNANGRWEGPHVAPGQPFAPPPTSLSLHQLKRIISQQLHELQHRSSMTNSHAGRRADVPSRCLGRGRGRGFCYKGSCTDASSSGAAWNRPFSKTAFPSANMRRGSDAPPCDSWSSWPTLKATIDGANAGTWAKRKPEHKWEALWHWCSPSLSDVDCIKTICDFAFYQTFCLVLEHLRATWPLPTVTNTGKWRGNIS